MSSQSPTERNAFSVSSFWMAWISVREVLGHSYMHQLCPQRGEWSCPDILKSPSWKKGKVNSQNLIKAWGCLSTHRWWVHLSGSAGYLPLENGAAPRGQASGWQSCRDLDHTHSTRHLRLGQVGFQAKAGHLPTLIVIKWWFSFSISIPSTCTMTSGIHLVCWRRGFVPVQCCFSCHLVWPLLEAAWHRARSTLGLPRPSCLCDHALCLSLCSERRLVHLDWVVRVQQPLRERLPEAHEDLHQPCPAQRRRLLRGPERPENSLHHSVSRFSMNSTQHT